MLLPRAGHAARARRRVVRPRQGVEDGRAGARRRLAVGAFPEHLAPLGVLLHGLGPRPRRRAQVPRDFVQVGGERRLDGRAVFVGEGALFAGPWPVRVEVPPPRVRERRGGAAQPVRGRVHQMRDLLGRVRKDGRAPDQRLELREVRARLPRVGRDVGAGRGERGDVGRRRRRGGRWRPAAARHRPAERLDVAREVARHRGFWSYLASTRGVGLRVCAVGDAVGEGCPGRRTGVPRPLCVSAP